MARCRERGPPQSSCHSRRRRDQNCWCILSWLRWHTLFSPGNPDDGRIAFFVLVPALHCTSILSVNGLVGCTLWRGGGWVSSSSGGARALSQNSAALTICKARGKAKVVYLLCTVGISCLCQLAVFCVCMCACTGELFGGAFFAGSCIRYGSHIHDKGILP